MAVNSAIAKVLGVSPPTDGQDRVHSCASCREAPGGTVQIVAVNQCTPALVSLIDNCTAVCMRVCTAVNHFCSKLFSLGLLSLLSVINIS